MNEKFCVFFLFSLLSYVAFACSSAEPISSRTHGNDEFGYKAPRFDKRSCKVNVGTGSCYNIDSSLNEISGIASHSKIDKVFWVHLDQSDGDGAVFAINKKGEILSRQNLKGIRFVDTEDITVGPGPTAGQSYVYVGDIGSKGKQAGRFNVIRFPEPMVDDSKRNQNFEAKDVENLTFDYHENFVFDFETMFIDPIKGSLFFVQKGGHRVYKASRSDLNEINRKTIPLKLVRSSGDWSDSPSGGNMSPDGDEIVLRNETKAWLFHRSPGQSVEDAMGTIVATIEISNEFNGEAITFDNKGVDIFTASENQTRTTKSSPQPISIYRRIL